MADRPSWDQVWMDFAVLMGTRSTCAKKKVGAVLVHPTNKVISTGYNGAPSRQPHCTEEGCILGPSGECVRAVHAEVNAIFQAGAGAQGARLYTTLSPCYSCAKTMVQAGILELVYLTPWTSWLRHQTPSPIDLLVQSSIPVRQMPTRKVLL